MPKKQPKSKKPVSLLDILPGRATPRRLTAVSTEAHLNGLQPVGGEAGIDLNDVLPLGVKQADAPAAKVVDTEPMQPRFCLCEVADGEFPIARVFGELSGFLRRLALLDGRFVNVWGFFGVPIRLSKPTKCGDRYIQLGDQVFRVPNSPQDKIERLALGIVDLEYQDDGWLGPEEMSADSSHFLAGDQALPGEQENWAGEGTELVEEDVVGGEGYPASYESGYINLAEAPDEDGEGEDDDEEPWKQGEDES